MMLTEFCWNLISERQMDGYNPSKHTISYFLNHISKNLDKRMGNYDNFILLGDFNSMMIESQMLYNLSNLIKEPTCYKNPLNPTSIDVILTNRVNIFQKMVVTVLKVYVKKLEPITVKYRCHNNFCMNDFTENLKQKLESFGQMMSYDDFKDIFMTTLNNHAPEKNIL